MDIENLDNILLDLRNKVRNGEILNKKDIECVLLGEGEGVCGSFMMI